LFYSLFLPLDELPIPGGFSYVLTECTKQLALSLRYPDNRIGRWLGFQFHCHIPYLQTRTIQLPDEAYEELRHHLRRASTAIYAKVFLQLPPFS
jgi:hypothetical protein